MQRWIMECWTANDGSDPWGVGYDERMREWSSCSGEAGIQIEGISIRKANKTHPSLIDACFAEMALDIAKFVRVAILQMRLDRNRLRVELWLLMAVVLLLLRRLVHVPARFDGDGGRGRMRRASLIHRPSEGVG